MTGTAGGSAYAPAGQRSRAQREHDSRAALKLLARAGLVVGRAEGYRAGFDAGRRAGRLEVWRDVGAEQLVEAIRRDLDSIRRDLDR